MAVTGFLRKRSGVSVYRNFPEEFSDFGCSSALNPKPENPKP